MPGISVLGPVTLEGGDGDPVVPGSRRQRLLLALLVGRAPRPVTADALVEALWGDGALPAHPAAALQSQVFRLRRQLGTAGIDLVTEGSGYRLAVTCDDVDADRFALLVARAGEPSAAPAAALALLDEALGLWRGRAYEEVADHDAVRGEALRLEELRAEASEARAALLIGVGRAHEAARAMEALAADHPFRERPVALRMQALAATGRHGEALAALAAFRRELAEELGLEPSPELARLEGELVRHERPAVARPGLPGNSLVGREVELAAVTARLRAGRLVTLTGPGGVGKSRLALHAAVRAAPEHPDGVFLCELAEVVADEAVAPAVATALRIQRGGGATDTDGIVDVLATRRALVVLDNCEHVLDGARALVAAVLAGAAEVDVLATSRRRLGVEGEQVIPVAPLPVPERDDPEAPAVVLFVDRVRDLRPDFALDRATTAAACALCRLVDGLPLAIELAAARAVALSPAEIVADVAGRLHRLGDPARSRERHRSIEAVVAGSYDPLPPVERRVARTVAVFAGGFTLGAAAEVAGVDPGEAGAALTSLVETSLVVARDAGGITRFSMLEPVRQFAEARAAEDGTAERARARHAAWAARWIEAADAGLRGPDEAAWAGTIGAEMANLRAAHGWCLTNDLATAVRIAGALYWHGYWYGGTEAFGWATATVARAGAGAGPSGTSPPDQGPPGRGTPVPPSPPAALAAAYGTAALGAVRRGDIAEARALAGRGIALADDPTSRFAWEALSSAELLSGRYEQAMACQQRAREGARAVGDTAQEAREHAARALVLGYLGRGDEAVAELAAATARATAAGNPTVAGFCDYVGGEIRMDTSPAEALPRLVAARDAARSVGNSYLAAIAGLSALSCGARIGDPAESLHGYAELLDYFDRTGSPAQQWTTVRTLIEALTRLGHDEPAAVLSGALAASPAALPLIGPDAVRMREATATLASRLGRPAFARLSADGAALGDDHAMAYARRHTLVTGAGRAAGAALPG